jgi:hypothetical protein
MATIRSSGATSPLAESRALGVAASAIDDLRR